LQKADAEALRILQSAEITAPPVNVDQIAKKLGATVLQDDLDPEVSGLLYRRLGSTVIAVNRDQAETRRRFTIAHELGHFRLHDGRPLIVDHVVRARINLRDHRSSLATNREEIEANRFAATLLMPPDFVHAQMHDVIKKGLGELATIEALAKKFGVSPQAMGFRLTNLGLRAAV
jgi:Zn-dependent peptidase ImmA (M78 family)